MWSCLVFMRAAMITSKWASYKMFLPVLTYMMSIKWAPMRMKNLYGTMQGKSFIHQHVLQGPIPKPEPWLRDSRLSCPSLHRHTNTQMEKLRSYKVHPGPVCALDLKCQVSMTLTGTDKDWNSEDLKFKRASQLSHFPSSALSLWIRITTMTL